MANLTLAFAELLAGAIVLDAGLKGDSIANVVQGKATSHPLAGAGTGTGSPGGASTPTGGLNLPAGTYTNPVPGASASRVDQGTDYTLSPKGFLAPGNSKILIADSSNAGWRGGGYIAGQLLDGPLKGMVWFVAEGVKPIVHVGQTIAAGAQVVTRSSNPYNGILGNIEAGWANPSSPGSPLAKSTGGYTEGAITAAGVAWNNFVKALGGAVSHSTGSTLGHLTGPLAGL